MTSRVLFTFGIGPTGAAALSILTLPVMTWVFPVDAIGKLAMLQAAISLCTLLFCMGLDQAYCREYHGSVNRSALFLASIIPGLILMGLTLSFLLLLAPTSLANFLYGKPSSAASLWTVGCISIVFITRFLSLILRMQERGLAFSTSQLLGKVLLFIFVSAAIILPVPHTFDSLLAAQFSALFLTMLLCAWNTLPDWVASLRSHVDALLLKRMVLFSTPLLLSSLAFWGFATIDRLFLRSFSNFEQLALHSIAVSIAAGATILCEIFNIVWAPAVYKWIERGDDLSPIDRVINVFSMLVPVFICIAGGCSWILQFVLPSEYHQVSYLLLGCMIAPLFYSLSEVTGIGINVTRRTGLNLVAAVCALLLNVALCYLLVPQFGATGATTSTALA